MPEKKPTLKRELSFIHMISIAAGAVIGGWLAEAPYWFSVTGAGGALVFPVLALFLVPVGLAFAELSAMLPFASSVNVWTSNALGKEVAWYTNWMMYLVQVVEPPLMAFIFITVINHFTPVELDTTSQTIIAIGIVSLWYVISNFKIRITGTLSTIFFFSMVILSIIVALTFFFSGHWSWDNINISVDGFKGGLFPKGFGGIFIAMAVFSLKYIGFEMTPTMIEETKFPAKRMWLVIISALVVPAVLYLFVVFAIGGMAPWNEIAGMAMPEPELVTKLGLPAIIGIIAIISGCLHALTTLMGFWTSSARVIYGSAQLNQLPRSFMRLNRYGQPWIANLIVLGFSIFFCIFSGENWVQYIYAISCTAAGIVYLVSCIDVMVLRKKFPDWERPYRAPGGNLLMILGCIISVWIIIGSVLELDMGGYISLIIYLAVGGALSVYMKFYRKRHPGNEPRTLTPDDIGTETSAFEG
ncbi:MAG: APC family permease [Clostridiales bacterium]|jgi:APA family basic amino acid/polyamine antiporter|nr:APC family permease [Clostridiales bacterium]MDD2572317.1 APC family permease [Eubacteriales bacterium]MDY0119845.1 APC family permease [Clostridia bacterium]NLG30528.1 APC family permease [Clostridiaceae bacterium]MCK9350523.1 APC family permease [Clostridiales bacterium]